MIKGIYLDNSTVAKPSHKTLSVMMPFFDDLWGSTSAPHHYGQVLFPYIEEYYRELYTLFNAKEEDDVILTSSGAEAVNHVFFSTYYDVTRATGKNQFITSYTDEAPALLSVSRLESMGCVAKMAETDQGGIVTPTKVADALSSRTALVSLSWVNGLTGVINPIHAIAALCKERGVLFHVDATHALGKIFFDGEDIDADFISCSGEPLHGPKGSGALFLRHGRRYSSFIVGSAEQGGLRAGMLNMPSLAGFANAAKEAMDNRDLLCTEVARLRDKLEAGILKGYPEALVFFRDQERIPSVTAIAFPHIVNEAMLYALNRKGLYATIGGGSYQQISLILGAMGIEKTLARTALSFSLSRETTEDEIDRAIAIVVEVAKKLHSLSEKVVWG